VFCIVLLNVILQRWIAYGVLLLMNSLFVLALSVNAAEEIIVFFLSAESMFFYNYLYTLHPL